MATNHDPSIPSTSGGSRRGWFAVIAVGLGTFTLVTNEFLPVGLLTQMSREFGISEGVAGTMMTIPGVVAAVAAPTLTIAAGRIDRRLVLIAMSVLFTLADILGSIAPNFAVMLVARFLLGLGIGGFWAIGASVGPRLVSPANAARATAIVFSGVSIASVIGVPAGALIGGLYGWRTAFVSTAVLGVIALLLQLALLPKLVVDSPVTWTQLSSVLRGRTARVGLIALLLLVVGQFAAFTFIAPFLHRATGASTQLISTLLLVYGVAGIVGNFGVERALRRRLTSTAVALMAATAVSALALPLWGTSVPAVFLILTVWGLAYGAVPIALQTWIFSADPAAAEGGSALYIATFQLSVASGALLGGVIVDAAGIRAAMITGAVLAAAALVSLVIGSRQSAADGLRSAELPRAVP
ncbi:MFS transporter [Lacisediminihabitans sp.]|uniref:MFS transporter n=1 Tax=Lacisediminihabitans sp. TaxID=2787631 RepID=UPI00374D98F6